MSSPIVSFTNRGANTTTPTFVLPSGIGDTMWALLKIKAIASHRPIDIVLSGDPRREVDRRTVPFLKRMPFVREATVLDVKLWNHTLRI